MKSLLLFFFCFFFIAQFTYSQKSSSVIQSKEFIRTLFYESIEDEAKNKQLLQKTSEGMKHGDDDLHDFYLGYYGSALTLEGKHAFNPFTKFSKLREGLDTLSTVIMRNPKDLELRFLRFSVLHHIPSILGYSKERSQDLNVIYSLLVSHAEHDLPANIYQGIISFLIESGRLNDKQEKELEKIMKVTKVQ